LPTLFCIDNDNSWTFKKGKKEQTVKLSGSFKLNYGEMLGQAVESRLGISVISLWLIQDQINKGLIVPLLKDYELTNQAEIYLVYPEKNLLANKPGYL
jgi:DNA-binding transcriptional LysR family regulator